MLQTHLTHHHCPVLNRCLELNRLVDSKLIKLLVEEVLLGAAMEALLKLAEEAERTGSSDR